MIAVILLKVVIATIIVTFVLAIFVGKLFYEINKNHSLAPPDHKRNKEETP